MKHLFFAALLFLLSPMASAAATLHGKVVSVADGDTITLLDSSRRQHRIRLAEIDAPESKQAFGRVSKQHLADMVFGKQIEAVCPDIDQYGRYVCRLYDGERDVNLAQVSAGMAWCYRRYSRDPKISQAESEARAARRGLWTDKSPTPPWIWRRR